MTFPPNDNPDSQPENLSQEQKERLRYRVEISPGCHEALRDAANRQGKHMKVLAEEIIQSHLKEM